MKLEVKEEKIVHLEVGDEVVVMHSFEANPLAGSSGTIIAFDCVNGMPIVKTFNNEYFTTFASSLVYSLSKEQILTEKVHHVKVHQRVEDGISNFIANCPVCGAMLYSASHPSTFKEVFPIERPFCYHCGVKLDSSEVEIDESKYCNSSGGN